MTGDMLFMPTAWTHETRLPLETGIPGFWDNTVPVNCRTGEDTIHSSTPEYGSKEPVSVAGCYTSTFGNTDGPKGQSVGQGQAQSSQVRTSGTQGRVYAIVLEAEHADQSNMQGTFYTCIYFLMHHVHHCYILCDRFGLRG